MIFVQTISRTLRNPTKVKTTLKSSGIGMRFPDTCCVRFGSLREIVRLKGSTLKTTLAFVFNNGSVHPVIDSRHAV